MSDSLEILADSHFQMNPSNTMAEPIILDDSALVDFQLSQLLRDPETSNSTSPISITPSLEHGFDWMKSPYEWSAASIPYPESEPRVLQSSSSLVSEEFRKTMSRQGTSSSNLS